MYMPGDRILLGNSQAAPAWVVACAAVCGGLAGIVISVHWSPSAVAELVVSSSRTQINPPITHPGLRVFAGPTARSRSLTAAARQEYEAVDPTATVYVSGALGGVGLAAAGAMAALGTLAAVAAHRALGVRRPESALAMVSTTSATDVPKGVLLFPGQGTQFVGMAKDVIEKGGVGKALFDRASAVLGYDLANLCLEGPEAQLNATSCSQPAVMVSSLAALEELKAEKPDLMATIGHVAGFSLGEITALVAAGALSFEDGLRVVKARAEAMQRSCELNPGGMGSITGLADEALAELIAEAVAETGGPLQVANYLFPEGRVVSGSLPAVDAVCAKAKTKGASGATRLVVAGAFHTSFMAPAKEAVATTLAAVPVTLPAGRLLYSNVTAAPYASAEEIKALLVEQVVSPVQWERTATTLAALGGDLYEVGAGQQLKAMMKRIDKGGFKRTQVVGGWRPAK